MVKIFLGASAWVRMTVYLLVAFAVSSLDVFSGARLPLILIWLAGGHYLCFYPEDMVWLAECKFRDKRYLDAVEICRCALALAPDDVRLNRFFAKCLAAQGKQSESRAVLKKLHEKHPDVWEIPCELAFSLLQDCEFIQAETFADKAIALAPDHSGPYLTRAWIRMCTYDPEGCLEDCNKAPAVESLVPTVRMLKVHAHLSMHQFAQARTYIEQIGWRPKAGTIDVITSLNYLYTQNQFTDMLSLCAESPADFPYKLNVVNFQSLAYRYLNEGERALDSANQAMALGLAWPGTLMNKAFIVADAGYLDHALALSTGPGSKIGDSKVHLISEAYIYFHRQDWPALVEAVDSFLSANPRDLYMHSLKAVALAHLGRPEEAVEIALSATLQHEQEAMAWYALAAGREVQNDIDRAISALDKALSVDPHHRLARKYRGELHARAGNIEKSQADLIRYEEQQRQFMHNFPQPESL